MIVIVPCGAAKLPRPAIASRLYTGPVFRESLRYALSLVAPEQVYILSAKYGLLALTDRIAPYSVKMHKGNAELVALVRTQAAERGLLDERVIALGGALYTNVCRQVWPACEVPFAGVGRLGFHRHWMRAYHGRLPAERLPHEQMALTAAASSS